MSRRAIAMAMLLLVAGCAHRSTPAVAADPLTTVRQLINTFNAGAAGPVAVQQAELARLTSPGQTSVESRCPAATRTMSFDPVYARLAPAPGWHPATGTFAGTVYELPTLIRVYTGDRLTGTDLTDLHVVIDGGRGWLPALCVS